MAVTGKEKSGESWTDMVKTVVQIVVIVLFVRTVIAEPFSIPSGSMIPTLLVGDYVVVSKFSYGYSRFSLPLWNPDVHGRLFGRLPERGDVAVFREPADTSIDYIKRIVGLPGDRIQVKAGLLYINGEAVKRTQIEDFPDDEYADVEMIRQFSETLPNGRVHPILQKGDNGPVDDTVEFLVPPDHFFAMGDNRTNSRDSRFFPEVGYIPLDNLVGRAEFRVFSFDPHTPFWQIWNWPFAIRWSRILTAIH